MDLVPNMDWPGNVRELKSAIECAAIGCKGPRITLSDLPPEIIRALPRNKTAVWIPLAGKDDLSRILRALDHARGNRAEAARLLGLSRATLYRRLTSHHINPIGK